MGSFLPFEVKARNSARPRDSRSWASGRSTAAGPGSRRRWRCGPPSPPQSPSGRLGLPFIRSLMMQYILMVNSHCFAFPSAVDAAAAQELLGVVVAAFLAVLASPRQRLLIRPRDRKCPPPCGGVSLPRRRTRRAVPRYSSMNCLVDDGAADAHAHGAYLQIGLAAHGSARPRPPGRSAAAFPLRPQGYRSPDLRPAPHGRICRRRADPSARAWQAQLARYTAPGRSVPLKPHTPFMVMGSISMVSAP